MLVICIIQPCRCSGANVCASAALLAMRASRMRASVPPQFAPSCCCCTELTCYKSLRRICISSTCSAPCALCVVCAAHYPSPATPPPSLHNLLGRSSRPSPPTHPPTLHTLLQAASNRHVRAPWHSVRVGPLGTINMPGRLRNHHHPVACTCTERRRRPPSPHLTRVVRR